MNERNRNRSTALLLSLLLTTASALCMAQPGSKSSTGKPAAPAAQPERLGGTAFSTPVADYPFDDDLSSRVFGVSDLIETGTGSSFGNETVGGTSSPVRFFDAGNGLELASAGNLLTNSVFTIQMAVRLSDLNGGGSGFVKLIDFGGLDDDFGLYVASSGGAGVVTFFDGAGQSFGIGGAFPENDWVQVVLTRDGNNNIAAYLDGVQQFSYAAAVDDTDVTESLVFLDDDSATAGSEISAGAIACLRIYPTALDPADVAGLDCAPVARVGINGQACAFDSIAAAKNAAQEGDAIDIEAGDYNERLGEVVGKRILLRSNEPGSNCGQQETPGGRRVVIDGTGVSFFSGIGGILDINGGDVTLYQVDLTNGSTGLGGLVSVHSGGRFSAILSTLSNGSASADQVQAGLPFDTDLPSGGCVYAEDSELIFLQALFTNCRVIGPNGGIDPPTGDGGAVHARLGSSVEVGSQSGFTDNSARNGGAIALLDGTELITGLFTSFIDNVAENNGGAIAGVDSPVAAGLGSFFGTNSAGNRGGAVDIVGGSLDVSAEVVFTGNSAEVEGGAINISSADLAVRSVSNEVPPARFIDNSAQFGGAIQIGGQTTGALPNPTIDGAVFENNSATGLGGAVGLLGTADVEIVDTRFIGNTANNGGAIYSQTSESFIRSSSDCRAFDFEDSDRYCSEFRDNVADVGSAVVFGDSSTSQILTTALVGNSGPGAAVALVNDSNELFMESVWMFGNQGDGVVVRGDSFFEVAHGTFHNNEGSGIVGLDESSLFVFNSIAFGNAGGGVSSVGTGALGTTCNFDQSSQVGPNVDPLLVTSEDGQSHLDPSSPAVDACPPGFNVLQVDLDGRDRVFGSAPDAGAFEFNDIVFEDGFE